MEQCKIHLCVFRLFRDYAVAMIVCVHGDESTVTEVPDACHFLSKWFLLEFLTTEGETWWYLGFALQHDRKEDVFRVSQRAFVVSIVSRYGVGAESILPAYRSAVSILGGTKSWPATSRVVCLLAS